MKRIIKPLIVRILQAEASLMLKRYAPRIVVVTGTVGKTSTKEAIARAFESFTTVWKSPKSFNSEIGVPLTILKLPNAGSNIFLWLLVLVRGAFRAAYTPRYPKWLVLEVGADAPGDIKQLMKWVAPNVVVVSQLSDVPVHIENYPSAEAVIEEEVSPVRFVQPGGAVIWNKDDTVAEEYVKPGDRSSLTFGFSEDADVWASHEEILYENRKPIGVNFRIDYAGTSVPVRVFGALGWQHVYPVLAAVASGISQGANVVELAQAFETYQTQPGRMKILRGKNDSVIIDDSYNSSPIAARRALQTLGSIKNQGRKIALLGDMLELGDRSVEEHRKVGNLAKEVCDIVLSVGKRAVDFGAEKHFDSVFEAGDHVARILAEGDVILVKGSQGSGENMVRLERAIERFMAEPEKKKDLLVRQGKEWK